MIVTEPLEQIPDWLQIVYVNESEKPSAGLPDAPYRIM